MPAPAKRPLSNCIVLDASALMDFLEDRPGAQTVEDLIASAAQGQSELLMSVVNWGEVYYSVHRAQGSATAQKVIAEIAQLPIDLIPATYELTKQAAEFHARHKLPYADCFAAALATARQALLATSDKHFARAAPHLRLLWTTSPKARIAY
jgi:predicted nucleic acid-binding protein